LKEPFHPRTAHRHLQRQLDFDTHNLDVLDRLVNGLSSDFGQANSANFASVKIFGLFGVESELEVGILITTCVFKDVELLAAVELLDGVIDGATNTLRGTIGLHGLEVRTTLDAENDLVGIFGVFLKVSLKKDVAVVLWRSVEFASVPERT
jgi:hypothetical protein